MTPLREWTASRGMRAAIAGLAVAVALCVWSTAHALRVNAVAAAPATVSIVPGALDAPNAPGAVDVAAAISVDLFSPDRTAPAAHYRMPGEAAPPSAAPEPPKPTVLGTATAADGTSFATCQFQSARLLMVRVGDKVGDYLVKTIERGRVVFATPAGKTFEVLAPRAGS
jgi:hypothetical protein